MSLSGLEVRLSLSYSGQEAAGVLRWVQSSREDVPPPAPIPPSLPNSCVCPGCSLLCVALRIKAGAGPVVSPVLCCLDICLQTVLVGGVV